VFVCLFPIEANGMWRRGVRCGSPPRRHREVLVGKGQGVAGLSTFRPDMPACAYETGRNRTGAKPRRPAQVPHGSAGAVLRVPVPSTSAGLRTEPASK